MYVVLAYDLVEMVMCETWTPCRSPHVLVALAVVALVRIHDIEIAFAILLILIIVFACMYIGIAAISLGIYIILLTF